MTTYSEKLKDPRWQKKRLQIMKRDRFCCQSCDDDQSTLHVHHIRYEGKDPWDTPNKYLITLCKDCHKTINEQDQPIRDMIDSFPTILSYEHKHYVELIITHILKNKYTLFDMMVLVKLIADPDRVEELSREALYKIQIKK